MTTTAPRAGAYALWNTMPGWGIVADLTPPELLNARYLAKLRKLIASGLVVLLLVCAGGFVLAARRHSAAADDLATTQSRTQQLKSEENKYSGITKIQRTVTDVQGKVATLMVGDVDLTKLMTNIETSLPKTMTIAQESIIVSQAEVAGGTAGTTGTGLDTSGHRQIGNVTLSGAGQTLDDLSTFVDRLAALPGVINVLPLSNVTDKSGMQYSVSLGLTDQRLSHRYDVSKNGGR